MKRKIAVLAMTVFIVFLWMITLTDLGGIGPIMDKAKLGLDLSGGVYVVMEAQTDATGAELETLMKQEQLAIEERVNDIGLSEPVVTIEGDKRLRVELPGAEDAEEAIETIGRTGYLQFLLADGSFVLDGSQVKDAGVMVDQKNGGYAISLEFTVDGAAAFAEGTRKAYSGSVTPTIDGVGARAIAIALDGNIISAPNVNEVISSGSAEITGGVGGFSEDEAVRDALLIRSGALPLPLQEVNSSVQGAALGMNSLKMSVVGGIIGIALIFVLMLVIYRVMGLAANIALLLYIPAIFWILTAMGGVLTLPGIAGIILSIGMAVDANVIIFARIREEIIEGKTVRVSIGSGFRRAMGTIIDSQITTVIAAIVLYQLGTGPVRGFALTLIIGIVLSVLTATAVTQLYLQLISENRFLGKKSFFGVREDNSANVAIRRQFSFIRHRRVYYIVTAAILVIGLGAGFARGFNFGIDFTGGTMLQLDMGRQADVAEVDAVLRGSGIDDADIINAGEGGRELIIRTTVSLENEERAALLDSLYEEFGLDDSALMTFEQFGPSIGDLLKRNAVRAVIFASIGMLIYIIIRFEWKFGIAAIVGVAHDVLILIAFYGLFGVTVNNPFIAGVLTVVGYSINDTIVVFDRIRENLRKKKTKLDALIDQSINQTIFRSLMTSITTVLAIVPLSVLGGDVIRQFTTPLTVGILAGAASSIFLCSPIYYQICLALDRPRYSGKAKTPKKQPPRGKGDSGAVV
ncbi:MAG: protein translocase subunit SecD [Clostridiales Family XIII bacterium]|jgi:SecD/SecF fusion protein|nr:protein translocase subunit SecD [Clostridiales Family XIII bacterium]